MLKVSSIAFNSIGENNESKNVDNSKTQPEKPKEESKVPGGRLTIVRRQEEEAKQKELEMKLKEEKINYILDMFGSDFNIKNLGDGSINYETLQIGQFKDEAMKALQEKSFQGLYLRLQFWINQIYKRLHNRNEGCSFRLYKNNINVMKNII